jgi:hypothetical protein
LTGGGTIAASRTFTVGSANGITVSADAVGVTEGVGLAVNTSGVHVRAGNNQLVSNTTGVWVDQTKIDHNLLSNYDGNRHVDHTGVTLTAGDGLTGGGTIAASRTFTVGSANGITVSADAVGVTEGVGLAVNTTGVHVKANNGIVANSTGTFVLANTSSGLIANATGVHAKVSPTIVFDGNANLAVNSLAFGDVTSSDRVNTATFFATTSANVGANVSINTTSYFIGNSTQNVVVNSTGLYINGAILSTGGGYYKGNLGARGDVANKDNLFRINGNTQTASITISAGENALTVGPLTVDTGDTLTIETGGRAVII